VPFVGADAEVLERVLAPLVENARRYATTGVSIRVSADSQAVMLEVLDDGPGVLAGSEEDVFTPGRRLNPADGHDGAGLGLALARRLVRAGGGDLTSTAGPGGCFTVRLPRA
jgi:two-component system heavy metal sensor histidine kinase CusS